MRITALLLLILLLAGCTASRLVLLLDAVQIACTAAPIAVLSLEAAGTLTTTQGNLVLDIATTAGTDTAAAITEAESADAATLMATKIIADYSNIASAIPNLPPAAAAIVQAIINAVSDVVVTLGGAKNNSFAVPVNASPTLPAKAFRLSKSDKARLETSRAKIIAFQQAAVAARK